MTVDEHKPCMQLALLASEAQKGTENKTAVISDVSICSIKVKIIAAIMAYSVWAETYFYYLTVLGLC